MALGWKLHGDGKTIGPDEVVAPDERLSWGRTVGLGGPNTSSRCSARTFVFSRCSLGLNAQLAIHDERHRDDLLPAHRERQGAQLPSAPRRRSSARPAAIRSQAGATSATVTGAILVAGFVLALVGVAIHYPRLQTAAPGAPAGRHRRRRDAHRLQPRPGGGQRLLAAGPVGRPVCDDVRHRVRRRLPRVHRAHRDLPRPRLRVPALVGLRRDLRHDHRSRRNRQGHRPLPGQPRRVQLGLLVRAPAREHHRPRRQGDRGSSPTELLGGGDPARAAPP